jgi:hypothetical protein
LLRAFSRQVFFAAGFAVDFAAAGFLAAGFLAAGFLAAVLAGALVDFLAAAFATAFALVAVVVANLVFPAGRPVRLAVAFFATGIYFLLSSYETTMDPNNEGFI